jgi:flagellar basal-body rod modification protein FlgD
MTTAVNSTTGSTAALMSSLNGTSSSTKTTTADEMQTRFLNLLVTQLKNQDPLNPMDNSQMTTQLSQISTVSGIEKLNATMEKLLGNYAGTQTMQAAAMIGKTVLTAGNAMQLDAYGAVGGVTLDAAADKVTVSIMNSAGTVVQTQNLGAQAAGTVNFAWDGNSDAGVALADGKYSFSVKATQAGNEVKSTTLEAGTVNAVTLATDGLKLQLANNKTANYSDVKQIMN